MARQLRNRLLHYYSYLVFNPFVGEWHEVNGTDEYHFYENRFRKEWSSSSANWIFKYNFTYNLIGGGTLFIRDPYIKKEFQYKFIGNKAFNLTSQEGLTKIFSRKGITKKELNTLLKNQ